MLKKAMILVMAIAMLFALAVPASAAGENGTITISNAEKDTVYSAYKLLDLSYENHGTTTTADDGYVYYLPANTDGVDWYDFLTGSGVKDVYLNINNNGIVTWKDGADAKEFAELALAYVKANSVTPVSSATAETSTVTLDAAGPGYYLVDSSMGALVVLTTATPDVVISEKNDVPTIEKKVLEVAEDGTETWEDLNRVEAGEAITYRVVVNVKNGAQNYVLHDDLDDNHLAYLEGSMAVYLNDDGTKADAKLVNAANYTLTQSGGDGCTFEIAFSNDYLKDLGSGDVLTVYYDAVFVGTVEAVKNAPHDNTAWLTYGSNNGKTVEDTVQTVSYGLEVLKYGNGNVSLPLGDATFELYRDEACSDQVKVHFVEKNAEGRNIYTVCNRDHAESSEYTTEMVTTDETGSFILYGLDLETYYLVETQAPAGYNPLEEAVEVVLDLNHVTSDRIYDVNINNNTGSILPDTGGVGTTVFYVVGGLLVLGAVVMLIIRKRMKTDK